MGRGMPPGQIKRARKQEKRTEQGALFQNSPAILYLGTGKDTKREDAFIFNDQGEERFIKDTFRFLSL